MSRLRRCCFAASGEERRRANEDYRRHFPLYGSRERMKPYNSEATGQLTISLVASGYRREGRPASWSDRKSLTLEDKLPQLLQELELRSVEDDERGGRGETTGQGAAAPMGAGHGPRARALPRGGQRQGAARADRRAPG